MSHVLLKWTEEEKWDVYPVRAVVDVAVRYRLLTEDAAIEDLRGAMLMFQWKKNERAAPAELLDTGSSMADISRIVLVVDGAEFIITQSMEKAMGLLLGAFFIFNIGYPRGCPLTMEFLQSIHMQQLPDNNSTAEEQPVIDAEPRNEINNFFHEDGECENFYPANVTALGALTWIFSILNVDSEGSGAGLRLINSQCCGIIFLESLSQRLNYIMRSRNITKMARDMARFFWTPSELQVRSLTGQPCRRLADSAAKQQATPEKAEVIMNVIQKVVDDNPTEEEASKRLAVGRNALRDILAEMGRLGQRSRTRQN
ncbi:hypothetical protein HPB50_021419 [Hyalomma asiaticum]|uniref:Uncharacterized protein n=1 Tax=Hyalomma asiaticum TaxID=266040 RepID=A0ACB7RNT2_HYAAI|nr:hypothetical protein HPB50_021419 [Hyalomma asiaticum]